MHDLYTLVKIFEIAFICKITRLCRYQTRKSISQELQSKWFSHVTRGNNFMGPLIP